MTDRQGHRRHRVTRRKGARHGRSEAAMIITTTPGIEGKGVSEYLGVVAAQGVLGVNLFKDVTAGSATSSVVVRSPMRTSSRRE